jgi:hypothetical protein
MARDLTPDLQRLAELVSIPTGPIEDIPPTDLVRGPRTESLARAVFGELVRVELGHYDRQTVEVAAQVLSDAQVLTLASLLGRCYAAGLRDGAPAPVEPGLRAI